MEAGTRKPFEGITNVIRFNWHFYAIGASVATALLIAVLFVSGYAKVMLWFLFSGILVSTFLSLAVSFYVYDKSDLYKLHWLPELSKMNNSHLVNINAGFDETSYLLARKYPAAHLTVFDFYNAEHHTEISIERARKRYASYPGTVAVSTTSLPLENESADAVFLIFSAHEIRNKQERIAFFAELKNKLKPSGTIIVTEHLRDAVNFIAYNIGFLHFFSRHEWKQTFGKAGLQIIKESTVTPFVHAFILQKHGAAL